jgi:tetratricopeptide (TPR) repeat protein
MYKWILILIALVAPAVAQGQGGAANQEYEKGQQALDARRWDEALKHFAAAAGARDGRVDAALYWQAYALSKLGRGADALRVTSRLETEFPSSRWLDDARALALEVRQAAGETPQPNAEPDEDLKLMALNSLMHQDPEQALPILEKFLNGSASPKLKERALFVLAQSNSAKARELMGQIARGSAHPELQLRAINYLGVVMGNAANRQILQDVYAGSNDARVKRAIIRAYMVGGDDGRLATLAKSEKDPGLRKEAIRMLGVMGRRTADALLSIYASETDAGIKKAVINGLFVQNNAKALIGLARAETNPELKKDIVSRLSIMHSKEATDYMMEILNK